MTVDLSRPEGKALPTENAAGTPRLSQQESMSARSVAQSRAALRPGGAPEACGRLGIKFSDGKRQQAHGRSGRENRGRFCDATGAGERCEEH